jgi:uncharacterized protein (DUF3084 family)
MTDKQKLAELKEQIKNQKDYIKGVKKEYKSTISKMKKSCQKKTKKYNAEMKKLSKKTLDLKLEKEELVECEHNIEYTIGRSKREIDEHIHDLDIMIAETHKLK